MRQNVNLIFKSNETGTKRTESDNTRTNHCHSKTISSKLRIRLEKGLSNFYKNNEKSVNMLTEEEMLFEDQYVLDYLEEKDFSGTNRQFQVFLYDEVFQTILEVGYRSQIRRIDQSCFIQNYE